MMPDKGYEIPTEQLGYWPIVGQPLQESTIVSLSTVQKVTITSRCFRAQWHGKAADQPGTAAPHPKKHRVTALVVMVSGPRGLPHHERNRTHFGRSESE